MLADLTEFLDNDYDDLDSYFQPFWLSQNEEGKVILESKYNSPTDKSRKTKKRKPVKITFSELTSLKEQTINKGKVIQKRQQASSLKD